MGGLHLAVSGGVGGAKLALGLSHVLEPAGLTIVANTGDDFEHLGFCISPDLDTVMYTLADVANKEVGWGQAGESWQFIDALKRYEGETWFQLGDRDLATHVVRTQLLNHGLTLSEVTKHLCAKLGIRFPIVPMTDNRVATIVKTEGDEELAFQHYFVRDRCEPVVTGFRFEGIDESAAAPEFAGALEDEALASVVICPSNPFVSVAPVLDIPGVVAAIQRKNIPVIAVSPIVGGQAIKGPAAKMMQELGMPQSALAVARFYAENYPGLLSTFVMDTADESMRRDVEQLGLQAVVTNTVMVTLQDRIDLARLVLSLTP